MKLSVHRAQIDTGNPRVLAHDVSHGMGVHAFAPAVEAEMFVATGTDPLRSNRPQMTLHQLAYRFAERCYYLRLRTMS